MFSHLKSFLSNNLDFLNTLSSNVVISNVNKFLIYESENHINHDNDEAIIIMMMMIMMMIIMMMMIMMMIIMINVFTEFLT